MKMTDDPEHETPFHDSSHGSPASDLHFSNCGGWFSSLYKSCRAATVESKKGRIILKS